MNANVFMLFDCFLDEDQEVEGLGEGNDYDDALGDRYGYGEGWGWGDGRGWGCGSGMGDGSGLGLSLGRGTGTGTDNGTCVNNDEDHDQIRPTLCLVEIRRSSNER